MRRYWAAAALVLAFGTVQAQDEMRARDIFYGRGKTSTPRRTTPVRPGGVKTKPPDAPSAPVPAPASSDPTAPAVEARDRDPAPSDTNVQLAAASGQLALRYTIEKSGPSGWTQVDGSQTFTSGDRIRAVIETNDPGYLLVVTQGTSKKWDQVFPAPGDAAATGQVRPGDRYVVPKTAWKFNAITGTEKVFVVLSRQPLDAENLIYSLDDQQKHPKSNSGSTLAKNTAPLEDEVVQRLRKSYSRDLIVEDENKAPAPEALPAQSGASGPDRSVYIATRSSGPNARVIADISLRHQ